VRELAESLAASGRERWRHNEARHSLLPTLAQALDGREVFRQIAAVARVVIPHDRHELRLLSEDRERSTLAGVTAYSA
jgi:hypothetical protein